MNRKRRPRNNLIPGTTKFKEKCVEEFAEKGALPEGVLFPLLRVWVKARSYSRLIEHRPAMADFLQRALVVFWAEHEDKTHPNGCGIPFSVAVESKLFAVCAKKSDHDETLEMANEEMVRRDFDLSRPKTNDEHKKNRRTVRDMIADLVPTHEV